MTHKEITRFFMTIPEAVSLVLKAGLMARGGEIFVLDMGQPVKIYDLAVNLIKMKGYVPGQDIKIEIVGLRPGEKLYEELLVKTEELDKTENSMIFIERDTALSEEEISRRLALLQDVCDTGDDDMAREALRKAVPTFRKPEEVNKKAVLDGKHIQDKTYQVNLEQKIAI